MYSNVLSFFLYFYLFIFFSVPVILFFFFIIIFSVTQLKYCIVSFYIHCWQSSKLLLSHSTPLLTLFTSKSPSTCSNLCLFHHIHSVTYTAFEELSRWPCPIVNTVLLISFASQPLSYTKHISHKSHRCIALPIHTHMYSSHHCSPLCHLPFYPLCTLLLLPLHYSDSHPCLCTPPVA